MVQEQGGSGRAGLVRRARQSDDALVDEALAHIRKVWNRGLLETVVTIGDYIIQNFYGGDLEEAQALRAHKPAALARLVKRADELPISAHALKECVRISSQYHRLPAPVADRLSKSQHVALLRVTDPEVKRRLAEEAISQDLSVRALEARTRKIQHPHAGGRPAEHPLIRRTGSAVRALEPTTLTPLLTGAALRELNPEQVRLLTGAAHALRDAAERIGDALGRRKTEPR